MNIYADRNILALENSFNRFGDLQLFEGRSVKSADLKNADVLLVRSITQVNEALLSGTNIQFVGSATSGTDHIDLHYLQQNEIAFADAKGSNANAVVDYCFAAICHAELRKGLNLEACSVGIVGAGHVGGLFARKLSELNISIKLCDPLLAASQLAEASADKNAYFSLEEVMACDVVSLHLPLTTEGKHATANLIGSEELQLLPAQSLLINTCRGGVVDESALIHALRERRNIITVFDVWNSEPNIDVGLANAVDLATPHIAGYSAEAKKGATIVLFDQFRKHFELGSDEWGLECGTSEAGNKPLNFHSSKSNHLHLETVLQALPLEQLSKQFKSDLNTGTGGRAFDSYRQKLLSRHEFKSRTLNQKNYTENQKYFVKAIGFQIEQ